MKKKSSRKMNTNKINQLMPEPSARKRDTAEPPEKSTVDSDAGEDDAKGNSEPNDQLEDEDKQRSSFGGDLGIVIPGETPFDPQEFPTALSSLPLVLNGIRFTPRAALGLQLMTRSLTHAGQKIGTTGKPIDGSNRRSIIYILELVANEFLGCESHGNN